MPIHFRSLRSGSSGNCLELWTRDTRILLDCGLRSQRECGAVLDECGGGGGGVDAVVVSHSHSDHANPASLKVLGRRGVPVYCHEKVAAGVLGRRVGEDDGLRLRTFADGPLRIGSFTIQSFPVPHAPRFPNFGFVIHGRDGKSPWRKIVVATDFFDGRSLVDRFVGADFIFVEANHDTDLLRRFPNEESRYHLPNEKAGLLLAEARRKSPRPPVSVMLGHLSEDRNRPPLAVEAVHAAFQSVAAPLDFPLRVAPRHDPSPTIDLD